MNNIIYENRTRQKKSIMKNAQLKEKNTILYGNENR